MAKPSWTLSSLTLLNWGTYDGMQTIHLAPTGEDGRNVTCIEGRNGSGKTTLTDAYMLLLRPDGAVFNAASNSSGRGEDKRNVASYMRGEIGTDPETGNPWVIRDTHVIISAIKGTFKATDGSTFETAILMCLNNLTDTKERRIYATSNQEIDLSLLAATNAATFDRKNLRNLLGKDVNLTERPSEYQALLAEAFEASSSWTEFKRLTRLLSMVQGETTPDKSRINDLFKSYVFPPSDVKQRMDDAISVLSDSVGALDELTRKRELVETLQGMQIAHHDLADARSEVTITTRILGQRRVTDANGLATLTHDEKTPTQFDLFDTSYRLENLRGVLTRARNDLAANKKMLEDDRRQLRKRESELTEAQAALAASQGERAQRLKQAVDTAMTNLDTARETLRQRESAMNMAKNAIETTKANIETAQRQLDREKVTLSRMARTTDDYVARGRTYGLTEWPKDKNEFQQALERISDIDDDQEQRINERTQRLAVDRNDKTREMRQMNARLDMLRSSKSKLPVEYPSVNAARNSIAKAMGIKPQELPFVAELINLAPEQEAWRTAANAVFAPIATNMLIDKYYIKRFRAESKRLERELRASIRYIEVDADDDEKYAGYEFDDDTIAAKLVFDESNDYAYTAKRLACQNNAICVETATEFANDGNRYVTRGGQTYSRGRGTIGMARRTSNLLGFVLESDIEDAEATISDLQNDIRAIMLEQQKCSNAMHALAQRRSFAEEIRRIDFESLDIEAQDSEVRLASETLDNHNDRLGKDQKRLDDAIDDVERARNHERHAQETLDAANSNLEQALSQTSDADKILQQRVTKAQTTLDAIRRATYQDEQAVESLTHVVENLDESIRELDEIDTTALEDWAKNTVSRYVTDLNDQIAYDMAERQLKSNMTNARTKLEAARDRAMAQADAAASAYKAAEAKLPVGTWDELVGVAYDTTLSRMIENQLDDVPLQDPWGYVQVTWPCHYDPMLESLSAEWSEMDLSGARRSCAMKCIDTIEALLANTKSTEKLITRRMRDMNAILERVRLGSEDHTLTVRHNFRRNAQSARDYSLLENACEHAILTRSIDTTDKQFDKIVDDVRLVMEAMSTNFSAMEAALDPNRYVNISFIEHRDGHDHHHANLGKLSGGEVQQISACVIGAALLYAMNTEPGDLPAYATIVIDEAFVKSDEQHSLTTLRTLVDMGFVPIVSMPPEGVMKLSPCISRLLAVIRSDNRSFVDEINLAEITGDAEVTA